MRFMMIVSATRDSEAGVKPSRALVEAMMKYNEELVKAGVLLDAAGLHPSSNGVRVTWPGGKPKVTDGPFTETKELIAGYWIIQVKSKEEAIEWAMRVPNPEGKDEGHIEVRQLFEAPQLTDDEELVRKEAELRERAAKLRKS
jgi:hypothetical protein